MTLELTGFSSYFVVVVVAVVLVTPPQIFQCKGPSGLQSCFSPHPPPLFFLSLMTLPPQIHKVWVMLDTFQAGLKYIAII